MRRLAIALTALLLLRGDMFQDASNAKLPEARANLGIATFSPTGLDPAGVTDNTAQIQASLAQCDAAGGGEVVLPQGTFLAAGLSLPDRCYLAGQGPAAETTRLKLIGGANTYLVASSTYVQNLAASNLMGGLRDLTLDGNKTNNTSGDLFVLRGYRNSITGVRFLFSPGHAINFSEMSANGSVSAGGMAENSVRGNTFDQNDGAAVYAAGGPLNRVADMFIQSNVFNQNGMATTFCSIHVLRMAGFHITDNQMYGNKNCSVWGQGVSATRIIANDFDGTANTGTGINVESLHLATGGFGTLVIADNTFRNSAASLGAALSWKFLAIFQFSASSGVVLSGNSFYSPTLPVMTVSYGGSSAAVSPLWVGVNAWTANTPHPAPSAGIVPGPGQGATTVAALPACVAGLLGRAYTVTDSNTAVFNAAVAGGGANVVSAFCNGAGWVVH
jgi:hypothetical protein